MKAHAAVQTTSTPSSSKGSNLLLQRKGASSEPDGPSETYEECIDRNTASRLLQPKLAAGDTDLLRENANRASPQSTKAREPQLKRQLDPDFSSIRLFPERPFGIPNGENRLESDVGAIRAAAAYGVSKPGSKLPHLKAIQHSFGRHDISGVRAHVGREATNSSATIGAQAYTYGNDVAFAASPDLRLAAHEAAHVVQQRGGIRLAGGVGARGDVYECHADKVADLVVRGESAEDSLNCMARATAPPAFGGLVQRDEPHRLIPYSYVPPETTTASGTPDQLRGAPLADLFGLFVLRGALSIGTRITGFYRMSSGTTYSYEWAQSDAGTAIIRGEIRSQLLGCTDEQATAHRATVGSHGSTVRIAELYTIIDQAVARTADGHTETAPALLEYGTEGRTYTSRGDRRGTGESMGDRIHAATDVTSPAGTAVYAPVGGTVVFSGRVRGYGNIVSLVHEDMPAPYAERRFQTAYAHLSQRLVEGGTLAAGQAIGLVGATRTDREETVDGDGDVHEEGSGGRVAAGMPPHLHFGLIELFSGAAPRAWSSTLEESYATHRHHIRPDDWLAALHTDIGVHPNPPSAHREEAERGARHRGARRQSRGVAKLDSKAAVAAAQDGLSGAGDPLPHLNRLEHSFGVYELGSIDAHIGGVAANAARAIGATAYASGERVAFAETPSLWLAAHEAAHVIQQRKGDAPDGIGAPGDAHERHADAVADRVVRGESAQSLLDGLSSGGAHLAVQTYDRNGDGIDDDRRMTPYEYYPPEITRGDDDAARLEGLSVRDLFSVYAMRGHTIGDRVTGFFRGSNGATFSYAWVNSPSGTAALRRLIRRGLSGASAATIENHRTAIGTLYAAPPARLDELRALLDAAGPVRSSEETPEPGGLPPGGTQDQVVAAIAASVADSLRIDWVRRLQSHLRADGRMVSLTGEMDAETVIGVMWLQHDAGLPVTGIVDAATRPMIEGAWAELHSSLLGSHLESRVLVPGDASGERRYGYYRDVILSAGGVFLDGPREINMLGIRGAIVTRGDAGLEIRQSPSAGEFAAARSAAGDPLPGTEPMTPAAEGERRATSSMHFSGRTTREGTDGFDDAIITIWYELDASDGRVYHVTEHPGSVDPEARWHLTRTAEGTAHLRDGTYRYALGTHTTAARNHRIAVEEFNDEDSEAMRYSTGTRDGDPTTTYAALNAIDDRVEVWRDDNEDDDHFLTSEEETASDEAIAERSSRYVGRRRVGGRGEGIGINIHTSPVRSPSSQGCQNIPIDEGFESMMGEIRDSSNPNNIYYTLIDASRIDGALVSDISTPIGSGVSEDVCGDD